MVFEYLDEGILIMDGQRTLRYANDRARRLLGFEEGEEVGGRCRLTTRGVDCQNACPLTFALEGELRSVERFSAVYRGKGNDPVSLNVTVVPFHDSDGVFTGAVEILRPADPDPGFVACGSGPISRALRLELGRLAQEDGHVLLVGAEAACADVALAIHEASRLDRKLFHQWRGSWEGISPWPPGTVFGYGGDAGEAANSVPGSGWRIIVGLPKDESEDFKLSADRLEIPEPAELDEDLPAVIAAWVDRMRPSLKVEPGALERLSSIARSEGWNGLEGVLRTAVSAAGERLEDAHIPLCAFQTVVLDEVLRCEEPLAALEKRLLEEVLERSGWRMQDAAERLCMSRVTLWRKLKDHGIERPDNGDADS